MINRIGKFILRVLREQPLPVLFIVVVVLGVLLYTVVYEAVVLLER